MQGIKNTPLIRKRFVMIIHMAKIPHHSEINYRKLLILILIGALVLGSLIGGAIFIKNYFELKAYKDERDVELLKDRLGRHLALPAEEPLIATVTDVEKLKAEQPFYRNAQNGDKVFIWKDKALIYRLEEDKIIDFGIIVSKNPEQTNEQQITSTTIVVLNGAGTANVANQARQQIESSETIATLINAVETQNAQNSTYSESIVVDLNGQNGNLAAQIAETVGATVKTELPAGEIAPENADVVVIIGREYLSGSADTVQATPAPQQNGQ